MNEGKVWKSVSQEHDTWVSLICGRTGIESELPTSHRSVFTPSRFLHVPGKVSDHFAAPVVAFVDS